MKLTHDVCRKAIDLAVQSPVSRMTVSLDGNRAVHEYNRPLTASESSYDTWQSGLNLYKNLCEKCGKKAVISKLSEDSIRKIANFPGLTVIT